MVFNYDKLLISWKRTVVQSSTEQNRAKFKYHLPINLELILEDLNNGAFIPTPLRKETIMFPKKRIVQVPSIKDKIVQHYICDNYLDEILTKPLIKETGACIKNRGTRYSTNLLSSQLHNYYRKFGKKFYVLKCDIKSYFATIPHQRVYELIDKFVDDEDIKKLLCKFVNLMPNGKGLALGLQQSQLLANLYLSDLDHKCKEVLRAKYYGRYMDDFYIVSNDYEYLQRCYEYINENVIKLGLQLNPKTKILTNRIDYLGFTFHLTDSGKVIMKLEKSKRRSKHRHINKMINDVVNGAMDINEFIKSYKCWKNHALQGNCKSLVYKWDCWICGEFQQKGINLCQEQLKI